MKRFKVSLFFILILFLLFMPALQPIESVPDQSIDVLDIRVDLASPLEVSDVLTIQATTINKELEKLNEKILVYNHIMNDADESTEIYAMYKTGHWNRCISKGEANYNIRFS